MRNVISVKFGETEAESINNAQKNFKEYAGPDAKYTVLKHSYFPTVKTAR